MLLGMCSTGYSTQLVFVSAPIKYYTVDLQTPNYMYVGYQFDSWICLLKASQRKREYSLIFQRKKLSFCLYSLQ